MNELWFLITASDYDFVGSFLQMLQDYRHQSIRCFHKKETRTVFAISPVKLGRF